MIRLFLYYIIFAILGIVFDLYIGTYGIVSERRFLPAILILFALLSISKGFATKKYVRAIVSSAAMITGVVMALLIAHFILPVSELPYVFLKLCEIITRIFSNDAFYLYDMERGVNLISVNWLNSIHVFEISIYKAFPNILISLFFAFIIHVSLLNSLRRRVFGITCAFILFVLYSAFIIVCGCLIIIATGELRAGIDVLVQILLILPMILILSAIDFALNKKEISLSKSKRDNTVLGLTIFAVSFFALIFVFFFKPYGNKQASTRILIDDAHSDWEKCGVEFDENSFTKRAAYAATLFYRSLQMFGKAEIYDDSFSSIDVDMLENYDIFIIKTPTYKYSDNEINAIEQFVKNGGGLWLIGDHTNLFGMSNFLNQILNKFSMSFNYDSQFDMLTGNMTVYEKPWWNTDPAMIYVEKFKFLTGCTINAQVGSASMIGRGMCSEPVEYSHVNSFGNIKCEVKEGWGNYAQMASTYYGKGRVVAFTDSTFMSNFCYMFDNRDDLTFSVLEFLASKPNLYYLIFYQFLSKLTFVFLCLIPISLAIMGRKYLNFVPYVLASGYLLLGCAIIGTAKKKIAPNMKPYPIIDLCLDKSMVGFDSGFEVSGAHANPHADRYYDQFIANLCRKGFYVRYSNSNYKIESLIDMIMRPSHDSLSENVVQLLQSGKNVLCLLDFPEHYPSFTKRKLLDNKFKLIDEKIFNEKGNFPIDFFAFEHAASNAMLFIIFDRTMLSKKYHGKIYQNLDAENYLISSENFKLIDIMLAILKKKD